MLIAILAHKWSESLTVGISFITAEIEIKKSIYYMFIFTLFTPLGIFLGQLFTNEYAIGIANAISAGTFLYISTAEIIVEEFSIAKDKFWKFISYTIGIIFILFITQLENILGT